MKNMPNPTNRKELQRFLGIVTYLSKYIQGMSHLTAPLKELLEKETEWMWLDKHDKAVEILKNALTNSLMSRKRLALNVMLVKMDLKLYCYRKDSQWHIAQEV